MSAEDVIFTSVMAICVLAFVLMLGIGVANYTSTESTAFNQYCKTQDISYTYDPLSQPYVQTTEAGVVVPCENENGTVHRFILSGNTYEAEADTQ